MTFSDQTRFRLTELGKSVTSIRTMRKNKRICEIMDKALTEEERADWQKLEAIHPGVGLTSYEQDRMLGYMLKGGLIEIVPEEILEEQGE